MQIKDVLAANLRILCEQHGSYADVARQLGIRRQQLNTYLSAVHMPSENLLVKMCSLFKITQIDLVTPGFANTGNRRPTIDNKIFMNMLRPSLSTQLNSGAYQLYISVPEKENTVLRSVIVAKNWDGVMHFRRITRFHAKTQQSASYFRGVHHGIVLQAQRAIYLCAVNTLPVHEPSLFALEQAATSQVLYSGKALLTGLNGPAICGAVMVPLARDKLKLALKDSFAISVKSDDIPSIVRIQLGIELEKIKTEADSLASFDAMTNHIQSSELI